MKTVLQEAYEVVGERGKTYDNDAEMGSYPAVRETAKLWSAYLLKEGSATITPERVARMMALHKQARRTVDPKHRDSYVDEVAYMAIAADLALEE